MSVTSAQAGTSLAQRQPGADGQPQGAAANVAYSRKVGGYVNNWRIDLSQVKAMVIESGGLIHKKCHEHIKSIAHDLVRHNLNKQLNGEPIPTIYYSTQVRRITEDIIAALQRGNAACISNYITKSAEIHPPAGGQ